MLAVKIDEATITTKFAIGDKFKTTNAIRTNANTAKMAIDFLLNLWSSIMLLFLVVRISFNLIHKGTDFFLIIQAKKYVL
jgi:hypothetical protein